MYPDLTILVFGHSRPTYIADVLESLNRQGAISNVDVWLDGHQGVPEVKHKTDLVYRVVKQYNVRNVTAHKGAIGFRKILLHALDDAVAHYRYIIVLEDDCFPSRNAIKVFMDELKKTEADDSIFSVYGHPFLVPAEGEICTRFQGWGWATTSSKLKAVIRKLIYLYSLRESAYLDFVKRHLTKDVVDRLDVTPPRLPTHILKQFFAWDETIALLTVMSNQVHKKTSDRVIYNFGASEDSARFRHIDLYMAPPFNMIRHEDIWKYY